MSSNDGMDLKQYVSQTISDIIDGIDEVASKNKNRKIYFTSYQGGDRAIEFDIATVASNEVNGEVEGKTEGSIRVLSASFGGKKSNKYKQNNVSRIKFGVNIREGKNE